MSPPLSLESSRFVKALRGTARFNIKDFISVFDEKTGTYVPPLLSTARQHLIRKWATIFNVHMPGLYSPQTHKELIYNKPKNLQFRMNAAALAMELPSLQTGFQRASTVNSSTTNNWLEFLSKFASWKETQPPIDAASHEQLLENHPLKKDLEIPDQIAQKHYFSIESFLREQTQDPIHLVKFHTPQLHLRRLERQKLVQQNMSKMASLLRTYRSDRKKAKDDRKKAFPY